MCRAHSYQGALTLDHILGKLKPAAPIKYSASNPVTYSTADVLAARTVLQRLLGDASRNEVVSVREVVTNNNEI